MDCYQIWCDLKPGVRDADFIDALNQWMSHLEAGGKISGWRVLRKKLGLGPSHLGEFHILIDTENLAHLDEAFKLASTRAHPAEALHAGVNQLVVNFQAALYRDCPDPHRQHGEEAY